MDKKQMKAIQIVEIIAHHQSSGQDITGEWSSNFNIDVVIDTPQTVQIFNQAHVIDRIKMMSHYDEMVLRLATKEGVIFDGLEVSKIFVKKIIDYLEAKRPDKTFLKGWDFTESLWEILYEKGSNYAINHYPKQKDLAAYLMHY